MRPLFFLSELWTGFRRNLTLTIAMVVNVAIALGLIGGALLVQKQSDLLRDYFYGQLTVTVFLCGPTETPNCAEEITEAQRQQVQNDLDAMPQVTEWEFETQQQAYERFQEYFRNQPTIVQLTGPDTLPPSFRVQLRDPDDIGVLVSTFAGRPGVDAVTDYREVLRPLMDGLQRLQWFALAVGAIALASGILLVLNSTLVLAHSRRRELGIMRLVGAPNYYIRLPFVMQALVASLAGWGLAIGVLVAMKRFVITWPTTETFRVALPLVGMPQIRAIAPVLLLLSVVLAVVTSWLSLVRYLRV